LTVWASTSGTTASWAMRKRQRFKDTSTTARNCQYKETATKSSKLSPIQLAISEVTLISCVKYYVLFPQRIPAIFPTNTFVCSVPSHTLCNVSFGCSYRNHPQHPLCDVKRKETMYDIIKARAMPHQSRAGLILNCLKLDFWTSAIPTSQTH
jgi:hypothetical protein